MTRFSLETLSATLLQRDAMRLVLASCMLLAAASCTDVASPDTAAVEATSPSSPAPSPTPPPAPSPTPPPAPSPTPPPAPPTTPPPPASGAASVAIGTTQTSCVAPCGVFFNATATGFSVARPFHELSYSWDFGDVGAAFLATPADFPFGGDANVAIGPNAAHVFAKPGDYTVKVTAVLTGVDSASATVSIHVEDPDVAFAGNKTVCYSLVGDFTGCPAGATQIANDLPGAATRANNAGRLLLRAGESTTIPGQLGFTNGPLVISRFGPGADPDIHSSTVFNRMVWFKGAHDVSISNLTFSGEYDSHTGLGAGADSGVVASDGATNVTVYANNFTGLGTGIQGSGNGGAQGFVIADNTITNWWNFGILIPNDQANDFLGIVGNSIRQAANAVSGPGAKPWPEPTHLVQPNWPNHGPIRIAYSKASVVSKNDLFSNAGWSNDGADHQAPLRYMTDGGAGFTGALNQNRLTGGYDSLEMVCANTGDVAGLGDTVVERNEMVWSANTRIMVYTVYGGMTIRNNIAHRPAVTVTPSLRVVMLKEHQCPKTPENLAAPLDFVANTVVDLRNGDGKDEIDFEASPVASASLTNVNMRSNIIYAPNAANWASFVNPSPIDTTTFAPVQPSSAYKSAAPDALVFDDIYGKTRGVATNQGAID